MSKQDHLDKIARLRTDRTTWINDMVRRRYKAVVGPLTLHVDRGITPPQYMVEGERFGVMAGWTPLETTQECIHAACEFATAHFEGLLHEQHAE